MPALSSTMTEGKIVEWLKKPGDKVGRGESVLVVESDKADMDVESFNEGYLAAVLMPAGSTAPVGETIGLIVETEAEIADAQAKAGSGGGGAAPAAAAPAAPAPAAPPHLLQRLPPPRLLLLWRLPRLRLPPHLPLWSTTAAWWPAPGPRSWPPRWA